MLSDIKTYKIKNVITVPAIVAGLITNLMIEGIQGLKYSCLGIMLPFILLFILYALKMLGAGDIKLFCAIGSIMGLKFGIYSMVYSFLAGGVIAVILLITRKNGIERMKYLLDYLKTCFLTLSLQPYGDFKYKADGSKFHFAYAIICGTLVQLLIPLFV